MFKKLNKADELVESSLALFHIFLVAKLGLLCGPLGFVQMQQI